MKKKLGLILTIMLALSMLISLVNAQSWVEVTRFEGNSSTQTELFTEVFTCDYPEWRIRWEFEQGHMHFFPFLMYFNVTTWSQGYPQPKEDIPQKEIPQEEYQEAIPPEEHPQEENKNFIVDSIFEGINGDLIGTRYIQDNVGKFYMNINTGRIENYTIIVEQNIESIPEFPSWIILPLFATVTLIGILVRKRVIRTRTFP